MLNMYVYVYIYIYIWASLVAQIVKNLPAMQETQVQSLERRELHPTPVFFPGISHEQRRLVGYNPWGHKQLDTTEQLSTHTNTYTHTHTHTIQE